MPFAPPSPPPPIRKALGPLVLLLTVAGCGNDVAPAAWSASPSDILAATGGCAESVRVDLYLDATSSMSGYAAAPGSVYVPFLDNLESAISGAWADDSVRFFKFGTTVREIDRNEFRAARAAAFYQERGIFTTTNIDAVIDRVEGGRVGVIVTDLFQDDGDINVLVSRIKQRVFQRGLAAGVLALSSPFDGRIYDAPGGPYPYASTDDPASHRPFYALMFGEAPCLRRLHEALRTQPFVRDEHFLLLDRTVVEGYDVTLDKARDAQGLNRRASPGEHAFAFDVRPEGEGGTMVGTVVLDRDDAAPDVNADRLTLEVFRKPRTPQPADSTRSDDLRLRSVARRGDSLDLTLDYALREAGRFTYLARLRAGDIGGLVPPGWVAALSSTNPTAAQDPNKTLNLEKFVADLAQAAASAHRPVLAQFTLDVTKR